MTTTTLTTFLLDRIAEDEAAAERRIALHNAIPAHERAASEAMHKAFLNGWQPDRIGDPARVLAECEAKRRIVASEIAPYPAGHAPASRTLRYLAAIYSDHADYRSEWAA